jgi:small subunit ribosomal protein S17
MMADEKNEPEAEAPEEAEVADAEAAEPAAEQADDTDGAGTADAEPTAPEKPKRAPRKPAAPKPKAPAKPKAKSTPKKPAAAARERKPIVRLPRPERARGKVKERRGVVVSNAMDKTVVVRVDTVRPHPAYKKVVRRSAKFHAHDEANAASVGDVVRIVETRPISKTKSWRLVEILEAAK